MQNLNIYAHAHTNTHTHTLVCVKQQLVPDKISPFFNIEDKYSLSDYLLIAAILNNLFSLRHTTNKQAGGGINELLGFSGGVGGSKYTEKSQWMLI